jgi:hypothetical protein
VSHKSVTSKKHGEAMVSLITMAVRSYSIYKHDTTLKMAFGAIFFLADFNTGPPIIAHELELSGEDMTFPETQQEMIRKANTKLTFHILQGCVKVFAVTEDAIDNDSCVCLLVDSNPGRCGGGLQLTVDVIDKVNEGGWAVGWPKRYNRICPFDCIRSLKS